MWWCVVACRDALRRIKLRKVVCRRAFGHHDTHIRMATRSDEWRGASACCDVRWRTAELVGTVRKDAMVLTNTLKHTISVRCEKAAKHAWEA